MAVGVRLAAAGSAGAFRGPGRRCPPQRGADDLRRRELVLLSQRLPEDVLARKVEVVVVGGEVRINGGEPRLVGVDFVVDRPELDREDSECLSDRRESVRVFSDTVINFCSLSSEVSPGNDVYLGPGLVIASALRRVTRGEGGAAAAAAPVATFPMGTCCIANPGGKANAPLAMADICVCHTPNWNLCNAAT